MKIALDAMGGDHAPREVIRGALEALQEPGLEVILVGPEDRMVAELPRGEALIPGLSLYAAPEVIAMDEPPVAAVRRKRHSSIVQGIELIKGGKADAFVSAGNTGAVVAAALLYLGRLAGIERPALAILFPTLRGQSLLLDVGANADCTPSLLLQFAHLGSRYLERVHGTPRPKVAVLSVGEEETKGSHMVQEAHRLLRGSALNFIGNVDGKDLPRGSADVVVTDGFTGNVLLKVTEGVVEYLFTALRSTFRQRWSWRLAALALRPAFRHIARQVDYTTYGGALLLGVQGTVIIAHGRSNAQAIRSALVQAREMARKGVVELVSQGPTQEADPLGAR